MTRVKWSPICVAQAVAFKEKFLLSFSHISGSRTKPPPSKAFDAFGGGHRESGAFRHFHIFIFWPIKQY